MPEGINDRVLAILEWFQKLRDSSIAAVVPNENVSSFYPYEEMEPIFCTSMGPGIENSIIIKWRPTQNI